MTLVVEVAGVGYELQPGVPFTFGRDGGVCTVCLGDDPLDRGISRLAGSISHDNAWWWIINRSSTRSLHVVDVETGLADPLPVARENWPPARLPVSRPRLDILVVGEILTHVLALTVSGEDLPLPGDVPHVVDPIGTREVLPALTDKRREALVAMVEGYLLPFPHYRPEPRTYQEAADRLGLERTTVKKRIEHISDHLQSAGVPGLDSGDARRNLAEWLLANRLITRADLDWMNERRREARASQ